MTRMIYRNAADPRHLVLRHKRRDHLDHLLAQIGPSKFRRFIPQAIVGRNDAGHRHRARPGE